MKGSVLYEPMMNGISSSPTMQIEVSTHPSERLLEDLRDGVTDMALALAPADISSDLRFDKLGTTQHFVVARRGHPILRRPFTLEDLSRQKWIAAPWDAKWITDHFESNGLPAPTFSVRTNGPSIIFTGVLANSDLLTATDPALLSPRVAAALAMLPAPAPRRNPQYGLFWRKEAVFSPAMKRCRTELTRAFRKR